MMIANEKEVIMELNGCLQPAGDKSMTHRAIILSSLAEGTTYIYDPLLGEDCLATLEIFKQLGVYYVTRNNILIIKSPGMKAFTQQPLILNAHNSGTTARLLMGVLAALPLKIALEGDSSLSRRPMKRVKDPLSLMGAQIELNQDQTLPATITGKVLRGITYQIPMASAQVKSALMLAGMLAKGKTMIQEPMATRDHTEKMFELFQISYNKNNNELTIPGQQLPITPGKIHIPADISSAAYLMVAALLVPGSDVTLKNVGINPTRTGILEVIKAMKGRIDLENQTYLGMEPVADIRIKYTENLIATDISGAIIPRLIDEIPIIALLATKAQGTTIIKDAAELKVKESNRIETTVSVINQLGAKAQATADGMTIDGSPEQKLRGSKFSSFEDHRLALMLGVASLLTDCPLEIDGLNCLNISYPNFSRHLQQLKRGANHDRNLY